VSANDVFGAQLDALKRIRLRFGEIARRAPVERSPIHAASNLYSKALRYVFGEQIQIDLIPELIEGEPLAIMKVSVPQAIYDDVEELVRRENQVHELVENIDPSAVGQLVLEFQPV